MKQCLHTDAIVRLLATSVCSCTNPDVLVCVDMVTLLSKQQHIVVHTVEESMHVTNYYARWKKTSQCTEAFMPLLFRR